MVLTGGARAGEARDQYVGIPERSILNCLVTDYTIGLTRRINTAMQAIDKVRDTSSSHERCSIIEVNGKECRLYRTVVRRWQTVRRIFLLPEKYDFKLNRASSITYQEPETR